MVKDYYQLYYMVLKGREALRYGLKIKTSWDLTTLRFLVNLSLNYQFQWYIVAAAILKWLEKQYIQRGNSTGSGDNSLYILFVKGMAG